MRNKAFKTSIDQLNTFIDDRDWKQFHDPKNMAEALIVEAAELLEIFRFRSEEEIKEYIKDPVIREEIEDETADVLFWLLEFAEQMDIDLEAVLAKKLAKTAIKYPVEKSKGRNVKYNKL